jgi:hypothetical protein
MFEGKRTEVKDSFADAGYVVSITSNPADYILKIVNSDFDEATDVNYFEEKHRTFRKDHPEDNLSAVLSSGDDEEIKESSSASQT